MVEPSFFVFLLSLPVCLYGQTISTLHDPGSLGEEREKRGGRLVCVAFALVPRELEVGLIVMMRSWVVRARRRSLRHKNQPSTMENHANTESNHAVFTVHHSVCVAVGVRLW